MPGISRDVKGRVVELEVENFKSYRGRQVIGPFHNFTAVIGPNGSGKSNLMDAISFVLGVKGAQLRGSLKELLHSYTEENQESNRPDQGHVKLLLELDGGATISFTRAISPGRAEDSYVSVYSIDDNQVTWGAYEAKLSTFGILVKARNFLVFQGDIEAVAAKQPLELTKLFESISGSDALKAEYERLEVAKKDADDRYHFVQTRKKSSALEKKQKKEQKAEAEQFMKLQKQLEALKGTYYLWQLFHLRQEEESAEEERASLVEELHQAANELRAAGAAVKEKKNEAAALAKQRQSLEQKMRKKREEVNKKNPEHVKAGMERERVAKKLKALEREQQSLETKATAHEAKIAQLQQQVEDLDAAEKECQQQGGPASQVLSDEVMRKFHRLMEGAKAKTAKARADAKTLQTVQTADEQALNQARESLASVEGRLQQLEAARLGAARNTADQQAELVAAKQELQAKEKALSQQEAANRKSRAMRGALEEKRRKLEEQLRDSKASHKEQKKEAQARETVAEMKRLFKGVHGRMSELGKVTQTSYNLALAVVLGNSMDAVVVEDERCAKECIGYLKQKHMPPMTFVPLQTVKVQPPNERLREQLRGTASLALDLLDYDPRLERAFLHACGNTLVCEDEATAKRLAFGRGSERHKVVTKSGLLIAKSGAMTGGGTDGLESKAARFDEAHNARMRQELAKVEQDLEGTLSEAEGRKRYQALETEIQGLRTKIKLLGEEVTADQGRVSSNEGEMAILVAKKAELEAEAAALQARVDKQAAKLADVQGRINVVEDEALAPLSKEVGLENIREYVAANHEALQRRESERLARTRHRAKVRQQLDYERSASRPDAARLQKELESSRARLQRLDAERAAAAETAATVEAEVSRMEKEAVQIREAATKAEADVKALKKAEATKIEEGSRLHQAVQRLEAAAETLAGKQADILQMAAVEQVMLPRLEDEEASEAMEVDIEADAAATRRAVAALDFGQLSRQHRAAAAAAADRKRLDEEFRKDIEERSTVLNRGAPNLKALEQYQEAKEKDDKEKADLEEARRQKGEAERAFLDVRMQRTQAFMKALDHVKDTIDTIYKDLTKSKVHPMGGTAYLSLESGEEACFLTGIVFAAVPPAKRWRQMEELSGGEKTVAALALLFAIQSYNPAPFFVLDEIDAALDASNVARVANYIRERTRPAEGGGAFQAVVISLKDQFFSLADALVGVTKDPKRGGCSTVLTLDLNRFGEPEQ